MRRRITGLRVRHYNTQTLHPLLRIAVLGFQDQRLIAREYLKRLWNVSRTSVYFQGPDLVHVYRFSSALKRRINLIKAKYSYPLKTNPLTAPLQDKCPAPDKVKYLVLHLRNSLHFPFFSFNCPSITGCAFPCRNPIALSG